MDGLLLLNASQAFLGEMELQVLVLAPLRASEFPLFILLHSSEKG